MGYSGGPEGLQESTSSEGRYSKGTERLQPTAAPELYEVEGRGKGEGEPQIRPYAGRCFCDPVDFKEG